MDPQHPPTLSTPSDPYSHLVVPPSVLSTSPSIPHHTWASGHREAGRAQVTTGRLQLPFLLGMPLIPQLSITPCVDVTLKPPPPPHLPAP